MKEIIEMMLDKETKGAIRYAEAEKEPDKYILRTLYVRKTAFGEEEVPKEIKVTIESA